MNKKSFKKKELLCFNIEKELKRKVGKVASSLGMNMSTFVRWALMEKIKEVGEDDKGNL